MARTPAERAAILDSEVITMTSRQGRVATRTPYSAVVVTGKPVNHVLHLLLSLFCCGFWVPVWLALVAIGGETRHTLTVDAAGRIMRQREPFPLHKILILAAAVVWLVLLLNFFSSCASHMSATAKTAPTEAGAVLVRVF